MSQHKGNRKGRGRLIIIGGKEEKSSQRERAILEEVAKSAARTRLVVLTAATNVPEELWEDYRGLFKELGVKNVDLLDVRTREDAYDDKNVRKLTDGAVVFFTGGDQLRITSQIGDSLVYRRMRELYEQGGVIAGTSAGAAAVPETMLVSGPSDSSGRINAIEMAPGLGLVRGVVIDSHFAERGRMGRLLGAVAQNPKNLGLGIDEDTAVVLEGTSPCDDGGVGDGGGRLRVLGSGAVYVVDGARIKYSNLSERKSQGVLKICGVTLHVLGEGDEFDLAAREPLPRKEQEEQPAERNEGGGGGGRRAAAGKHKGR